MDEGTAHLDIMTEKAVIKSITDLGITRIIIAHRPETIKSADRVFSFQGGKLVEIKHQKPENDKVIVETANSVISPNSSTASMMNITIGNAEASLNSEECGWPNRLEGYGIFQPNSNINFLKEKK